MNVGKRIAWAPHELRSRKRRAAAVSIASNSLLVGAKIVAGILTGSIAILTEAIHSGIDLIASAIAFVSVGKSDQPPDSSHPYGHSKFEDLAAIVEGILIVLGAGIVIFEATRRLLQGTEIEMVGVGIAVMAVSAVANTFVSAMLYRRADETGSAALAADGAHLRTDAVTSLTVLIGLVLVELTGVSELDSAFAITVAVGILVAAFRIMDRASRVLVDAALPDAELELIRSVVHNEGGDEVAGFHKLRGRAAGTRRHIDMHVQFRPGTSLERAHSVAHHLERAIKERLADSDILIHVEPWKSVRPEEENPPES